MPKLRELLKRSLPEGLRDRVAKLRDSLAAPALETIVLHGYSMAIDDSPRPRLSLVIPSIAPKAAFGGVLTGLDIFLEIGKRTGVDLRIISDNFERVDRSLVEARAKSIGLDGDTIEILGRDQETPRIAMRVHETLLSYNWWTTLNIRSLLDQQAAAFGGEAQPYIYLMQDYEPHFYPFSSTHMLARLAFEPTRPCWGLFNSHQLHEFYLAQGHSVTKSFVFEPQISNSLRPALAAGPPAKVKRILVYGRPSIPRNCFPAVEAGLKLWAARRPEFADWEVVSAGMAHEPTPFAPGRALRSMGKLSLEAYAELLRTTAVGLSLMASPHPSYPPLEMAHFGIRTVTNGYANKNLASAHDNIISMADIDAPTVAAALAEACSAFERDPAAGWWAKSHVTSFLDPAPWPFLDEVADELRKLWPAAPVPRRH
jgi:hypothetical protein